MAYYYNVLTLLKTIRSDEANEARFTCTDEMGREFSYDGNLIRVSDITTMIHDLQDRYVSQTKKVCLFGERMPDALTVDVEIEDIIDNLQNTHPGYSFLDDPRNPFNDYRAKYGEWLLSDPERAATYVDVYDGKLAWKPKPCLELLAKMQEIRQLLLLLCIFFCWAFFSSVRGSSSAASKCSRISTQSACPLSCCLSRRHPRQDITQTPQG